MRSDAEISKRISDGKRVSRREERRIVLLLLSRMVEELEHVCDAVGGGGVRDAVDDA